MASEIQATTVKATNLKANDGTTGITVANSTGNVSLGGTLATTGNTTIGGTLTSTGVVTFNSDFVPATPLSHRNIIINGGMNVYQRGSLSITQSNNGGYALDRFQFAQSGSVGQWEGTMTQDTTMSDADIATTGQRNALKILTTTVENAIGADEESRLMYKIEAQDCQRLRYGTSSAQSATLSFWAKSTVAGDYAVSIWQTDGSDVIGSKYTLTANTWTKVSITFAGNTLENIANDNTEGLRINFMLIAGGDYTSTDNTSWGEYTATKLAYGHTASSVSNPWGTNANDAWYITGIQFELGSVATPFEHRSYADELARCQRYYYAHKLANGNPDYLFGSSNRGSNARNNTWYGLPTTMRSAPTVTWTDGNGNASKFTYHGSNLGNGANHNLSAYSQQHTINKLMWITDPFTGYDFYIYNLKVDAEL